MKEIHIGNEISKRLMQLRMTKTEFAKRMKIPQQNVNRILDGKTITTDKLQLVCAALNFDFFTLYQEGRGDVNVVASGDSSIAALNSDVQTSDCAVLQERVRNLEQLLKEKERLIQYLLRDGKLDTQT